MSEEICHLYDREICNVTEKECIKCQLEHLWNHHISLIINEINSKVGYGAFKFKPKSSLNDARKRTVTNTIERLKIIELKLKNLNI